jgi:hypothetical protein
MLIQMLQKNPLSTIDFAEKGLCYILDNLFTYKIVDKAVSLKLFDCVYLLIRDPASIEDLEQEITLSEKQRRRSSGGNQELQIQAVSINIQKVRSYFYNSATIFRFVKVALNLKHDDARIFAILRILIIFATAPGKGIFLEYFLSFYYYYYYYYFLFRNFKQISFMWYL